MLLLGARVGYAAVFSPSVSSVYALDGWLVVEVHGFFRTYILTS